jgi:hypothetical protein
MRVLPIPVALLQDNPGAFMPSAERVVVELGLDEDFILHVAGKAATQKKNAQAELVDLCFGLQTNIA